MGFIAPISIRSFEAENADNVEIGGPHNPHDCPSLLSRYSKGKESLKDPRRWRKIFSVADRDVGTAGFFDCLPVG